MDLCLSEAEQAFLIHGFQEDVRSDGRGCTDYRPIRLCTGVVPTASGSAQVRLGGGGTHVLATVKAQLVAPELSAPDVGRVSFFVDCSANGGTIFEGRGGEELAMDLTSALRSAYASALDYGSLCVVPGAHCWLLCVDVVLLEAAAGNLYDAVALAVRAALADARLPRVKATHNREANRTDTLLVKRDGQQETEYWKLDVGQCPLFVTVNKIGGANAVDVSLTEQVVVKSSLVVAVSTNGSMSFTKQLGRGSLDPLSVFDMIDMAVGAGRQLNLTLRQALDRAADTDEEIKRFNSSEYQRTMFILRLCCLHRIEEDESETEEGLTAEEINIVQTSWNRAVEATGGNSMGRRIVESLVLQKPKYGRYFNVPDGTTAEELSDFPEVIAQGNRVQRFIDTVVKSLQPNSFSTVLPLAKSVGVIHFHRGVNFEAETWMMFKSVVISEMMQHVPQSTDISWLSTNFQKVSATIGMRPKASSYPSHPPAYSPEYSDTLNGAVGSVWSRLLSTIVREMKRGFLEETLRHCQLTRYKRKSVESAARMSPIANGKRPSEIVREPPTDRFISHRRGGHSNRRQTMADMLLVSKLIENGEENETVVNRVLTAGDPNARRGSVWQTNLAAWLLRGHERRRQSRETKQIERSKCDQQTQTSVDVHQSAEVAVQVGRPFTVRCPAASHRRHSVTVLDTGVL